MYFTFASTYDAVSDVVESGGHWRSNFQIGSRVLKIVIKLFLCISITYNVINNLKKFKRLTISVSDDVLNFLLSYHVLFQPARSYGNQKFVPHTS